MKRTEQIKARAIKIKVHIIENKKLYIGIALGSAGTALAIHARKPTVDIDVSAAMINSKLNYKPDNTVNIHIEALGDPGNIIQDTVSGTVYPSQGQAARELGVTPARVSEHLSGKLETVNGHTLVKLGKAPVAA